MVLSIEPDAAEIGFVDGTHGRLPIEEMGWARAAGEGGHLGPEVTSAEQVVQPGDVIWVERLAAEDAGAEGAGAEAPGPKSRRGRAGRRPRSTRCARRPRSRARWSRWIRTTGACWR